MDNDKKHSLGRRAFFLFFSRRLKGILISCVVVAGLWYAERWTPQEYLPWMQEIVLVALAVVAAYAMFVIFQTWLEYHYYTYTFTDEAFIMTYGVVVRNEVAALYHQIQNVSIQRGVGDRFLGVSQIIIFLTGAERESGHTKIVLPAVGRKKAKLVQRELLVRAKKSAM